MAPDKVRARSDREGARGYRFDWAKGWTEINSRSYWLREARVQSDMDKPDPGYWCNMRAHFVPARSVDLAVKQAFAIALISRYSDRD